MGIIYKQTAAIARSSQKCSDLPPTMPKQLLIALMLPYNITGIS